MNEPTQRTLNSLAYLQYYDRLNDERKVRYAVLEILRKYCILGLGPQKVHRDSSFSPLLLPPAAPPPPPRQLHLITRSKRAHPNAQPNSPNARPNARPNGPNG
jgi:hypothetical protein